MAMDNQRVRGDRRACTNPKIGRDGIGSLTRRRHRQTLLGVGGDLLVLSSDAQLIDTVQRAVASRCPSAFCRAGVSSRLQWRHAPRCRAARRRAARPRAERAYRRARRAYSHKIVTLVAAERSVAQKASWACCPKARSTAY